MFPSAPLILITTINIIAVLILVYWARFLVKRTRENTEFADLLLQHQRVEDDDKSLGRWGNSVQEETDGPNLKREETYAARSKTSERVLRNLDVWKWAKYKEVRSQVQREQVQHDSSTNQIKQQETTAIRQRRTIAFSTSQ